MSKKDEWWQDLPEKSKARARQLDRMIERRESELSPLMEERRKLKNIAKTYRNRAAAKHKGE